MKQTKQKNGFTLLELLIVIAIIAILSVILVIVINPAETLKKSRDVQRMSDLSTLKTALGLYLTATPNPILAETDNNKCAGGTAGSKTIFLSANGYTSGATGFDLYTTGDAVTDGTGWVPVNFNSLTGGSPISNLPIDPVNTTGTGALASTSYVYRYACDKSDLTFELNAPLESTAYTSTDNKPTKDGGNNPNLYEVGTKMSILP